MLYREVNRFRVEIFVGNRQATRSPVVVLQMERVEARRSVNRKVGDPFRARINVRIYVSKLTRVASVKGQATVTNHRRDLQV